MSNIPYFLPVSSDQSLVTSGIETTAPQVCTLVSQGLTSDIGPADVKPAPNAVVYAPPAVQNPSTLNSIPYQPTNILDVSAGIVTPQFNPAVGGGGFSFPISPVNKTATPGLQQAGVGAYDDTAFTGSDLKVMLEVANQAATSKSVRLSKQLIELTTITVSVHRVKSPVVACGYINVKGWARGRRTIAGTMVFTKFNRDVLADFLQVNALTYDISQDTISMKVDQLPAFNLTFLFENEFGHKSFQRLLGVEFVTSGDVFSIQDMLSEQTVSYVCADFTPLISLDQNTDFPSTPLSAAHKTVGDVLTAAQKPSVISVQTESSSTSLQDASILRQPLSLFPLG